MSTAGSEVRLCGISVGEALLQIVGEIGLELSTCVGQGYDGAASLASERVGAAATFCAHAKKAEFFTVLSLANTHRQLQQDLQNKTTFHYSPSVRI